MPADHSQNPDQAEPALPTKSAPVACGSLPSGESDPSVTPGSAGAGAARNNTPVSHVAGKRITDRKGLVHIVSHIGSLTADTACGQTFALGRGRPRVWQLVPGQHHEICIICKTRKL